MNDYTPKEPNYSRDVIDDLKALSCCRYSKEPITRCNICPFQKNKPDKYPCNPYNRLVDSITGILQQLPGEESSYLLNVIDKCSRCSDGFCEDCPYCEDSLEIHEEVFYQHVYNVLRIQGLYCQDGTISDKGRQILISDTLALLKATKMTAEDWSAEKRDGLL